MISTSVTISNEAQVNGALTAIDLTGSSLAPDTNYTITLTNSVTLGDSGVNSVSVRGPASHINLGSGNNLVNGGRGDTITLFGNGGNLALYGTDEMVFLSGTNSSIDDLSQGMTLVLSGHPGNVTVSDFAHDPTGIIDLRGGVGGFTTPEGVVAALKSDGHGGTLLSFGTAGSLDFINVTPAQLTASHFAIG